MRFGMWLFLATEVMLFGGLFTAYAVYRAVYPAVFHEGSRQLDLVLGGINTLVLMVSSITMAVAVTRGRSGHPRWWLVLTAVLGLLFMAIKGVEYQRHITEGVRADLFMVAYFTLAGLHAVHLTAAIAVVVVLAVRAVRPMTYELAGLYWHFVDVIWLMLVALLYLVPWQPLALVVAAGVGLLIAWFFMGLWRASHGLPRLAAAAGVVWLGFLIVGTLDDVLTRSWLAIPGK